MIPEADSDFSRPEGTPNPKDGGFQPIIWPVFTENHMKLKKNGPREGAEDVRPL